MPSLSIVAACLLTVAWLGSTTFVSAAVEPPIVIAPDAAGEQLARSMIWGPPDAPDTPAYAAFRKSFDVPAGGASAATLRIFADSRYILWINGQYVDRGPCRFDWKGPQYDTIDIGPTLRAGRNTVVALVLGHGSNGKMMRHAPGLTVRLEAATAGGPVVVQTDATWRWSDHTRYGPPKMTWPGVQDRLDATREDGDWTLPDYDDAAWQSARAIDGAWWGPLTASTTPRMREAEVALKLDAALPKDFAAGESVAFDAGRLVQAYTEFELDAEPGTTLELPHANATYVAKAGPQHFTTLDTNGFAAGSIKVKTGKITLRGVRAVERIYPFDVVGSFKSSDPMLDRLWAVCVRSLQVLSEDAYVDCADRERVEWMDCDPPAFDVTRVALAGPAVDGKPAWSDARLLGAMLRRTALSLQPDGWVKAHTCSDRFDIHAKMEDRACDWISGARRYLDSTGDKALVREIWPAVRAQLDYFRRQRTERGLINGRDWETWGNPTGYQTFEAAGLNAFVFRAFADAAYLAGQIEETNDAAKFDADAKALAEAFNKVLWDEQSGTYYTGYWGENAALHPKRTVTLKKENNLFEPTGFAAMFALDQGIVPDERRARVTQYLLSNPGDYRAVMPYYYLFRQMYAQRTVAADLGVLTEIRNRWKPMSEWPWQTTWEDLKGGSKAHCYGMVPAYFLSTYVLGVRRDLPVSEKRLVIDPRLGDLTFAEGRVCTEFGVVDVSWKRDGDALNFTFTVPAGVTADLRLAGAGVLNGKTFDGHADALTEGRYTGQVASSHAN